MKIKAINLFEYEEPFQSPMITPKIKLNERKSLIIEILTHDDQSYYGECNAFATNWYDNETIERVIETINTWKSQIIGKVFTSFDAWLPYLSELILCQRHVQLLLWQCIRCITHYLLFQLNMVQQ